MPIHVIGLGVAEQAHLDTCALGALQAANIVVGSQRQLATVKGHLSVGQQRIELPKLPQLASEIEHWLKKGDTVCLLASGDPLYFGIGKWVRDTFPRLNLGTELCFYPGVSSIQSACHRLAWSLQDVDVISLHGRPLNGLTACLKTDSRYVLLTDKDSNPQAIATACVAAGFRSAVITVCEKLGYGDEQVRRFDVEALRDGVASQTVFEALNVVCLQTFESSGYWPSFPGIPDTQLSTDKGQGRGMLTKREVRLAILSLMQPSAEDCIWDVGAGCGGVSTELALWGRGAQVYAIEHHEERLRCLHENQQKFGLMGCLHIISGMAPTACARLPKANKVFVGGSGGQLHAMLAQAWQTLPTQGVLVASAVTEQSRQQLYAFCHAHSSFESGAAETLEITVSRGESLAGGLYYKPNLPVTLYKLTKQAGASDV
jgi:precorrin-6Y C5,15-methyltransferase (decarboxylating)